MPNPHGGPFAAPSAPSPDLIAVTPSDSADLASVIRQLYVGTGGDVSLVTVAGTTVVHKNVIGGAYLGPFLVARVCSTGTTATDLVGYI